MSQNPEQTVFGHPSGLFTLFFAEMWERFSYYGMRALLLFYMLKGFLGYGDSSAYAIYGAYTALVYMTPFFGGMIADRILGPRRAVVLGGLLMAAGHLMMTIETELAFFFALALLIAGNGFFKPNISTMVGSLYPSGSPKRDGGFTIFYMGINLGAAMSPLLCGYIGETFDWHYGFGLATIGMITGVAIFVAPSVLAQVSMFAIAIAAALNIFLVPNLVEGAPNLEMIVNLCNAGVLVLLGIAGIISFIELGRRQKLTDSAVSRLLARIIIMSGAVAAAWALTRFHSANPFSTAVNWFVAIALVIAGSVAWVALGRGGLPQDAGAPPQPELLRRRVLGVISTEWFTYLLALLAVPVLVLLVSGFAPLVANHQPVKLIPPEWVENLKAGGSPVAAVVAEVAGELSKPAGVILFLSGFIALAYLGWETFRLSKVPRERMFVVLILTFFSMLFWSFFEQAGSSVNNFTDRNIDRVTETRTLTEADVGKLIRFRIPPEPTDESLLDLPLLSQEQLGHEYGNHSLKQTIAHAIRVAEKKKGKLKLKEIDKLVADVTKEQVLTITALTYLRDLVKNGGDGGAQANPDAAGNVSPNYSVVEWQVTEENIGMGVGGAEIPASVFQSINPIYILLFGVVFSALWTILGSLGLEPSTPVKFSLGLLQLGLGFGAFWYGAQTADDRGMVALSWLFLGYLLQTTGELCLSPVGLSMVTKLSPARLVSTVMGMWFLATAFSQFLAAIFAQFTSVGEGGESSVIPVPKETVHVYGDVFGYIALGALCSGGICLVLSPLLKYWMHEDQPAEGEEPSADLESETS